MFSAQTHNGTITIKSRKTGEHRTLRIKTVKYRDGSEHRVVSYLYGQDNENDYKGFGEIDRLGNVRLWRKSQGSELFRWYARFLTFPSKFANSVDVNFDGRCRVCNRMLTTPESVASGIGPICAGK